MPAELFNWNVVAVGFILCIASAIVGYNVGYGMGRDEAARRHQRLVKQLEKMRENLKRYKNIIDTRI